MKKIAFNLTWGHCLALMASAYIGSRIAAILVFLSSIEIRNE